MSANLTFFEVTGDFYAVANPSISGVTNDPIIQPINALVTFTPRLPKGQLLYVTDLLVTTAYNAKQTISLLGAPASGTWTLTYETKTTAALAWNADAAAVQAALRALSNIGAGGVTVVANIEPQAFDVEFTGTLGLAPISPLFGNANLLLNAQGQSLCEITTAITAMGSPTITRDTGIALPVLTARVFDGVLSTIDRGDTPGFHLTSHSAALNLTGTLIYDVHFDKVTFNGENQNLAPFAFTAPIDATAVCLTDPLLPRLAYQLPNENLWSPTGTPLQLVGSRRSWRAS